MVEGDAGAELGVRVRLDGRASKSDVSALKSWLEREQPLAEQIGKTLLIEERPRTDRPQGSMGIGTEIVLVVIGSATNAVITELMRHVDRAVRAWLVNRGRVESGAPPVPRVEPLDPDER